MIYFKRLIYVIFCIIYYPISWVIGCLSVVISLIIGFPIEYIVLGHCGDAPQYVVDFFDACNKSFTCKIKDSLKI